MTEPTTPGGAPEEHEDEVSRALVARPEQGLALVGPPAPRRAGLPAIMSERLPALWRAARGPIAQAVVVGGLVAVGSVVTRQAATGSGLSLLPSRRAPGAARERKPQVTRVETEISEGLLRSANGSVVEWVTRRVRVTTE